MKQISLALDAPGIDRLSALSAAIGLPGFYSAAITFLRALIDAELGVVFLYTLDERPKYLEVQGAAARRRGAREVAYLDGPYVLDPVYQLFQNGSPDGAYAMADYVPDDFYESEFYDCFFRKTHLVDTIDILWRSDERHTLAFCLGRESSHAPFDSDDLALVRHALPLLFSAMRRHQQLAHLPLRDEADQLVHRKLQSTMQQFGASLLTKREREVVFYVLSGYSAEQTAQRLHTAEGTIRIHRKNIHRKLETGSQAELFSLFIQCIPYADPDTPSDPLLRYQGRSASLL